MPKRSNAGSEPDSRPAWPGGTRGSIPFLVLAGLILGGPLVLVGSLPTWITLAAGIVAVAVVGILSWPFRREPAVVVLVVFYASMLPGLWVTPRPACTLEVGSLLLATALAFVLALHSFNYRDALREWTEVIVSGGAALAVLGPVFLEYESKGRFLPFWQGLAWLPEGPDPNVLAGVLAMFMPLAVASLLTTSGKKAWSVFRLTLLAFGLVATESAGGWMAAMAACALLLGLSRRKRAAATLVGLFGAGVVILAVLSPSLVSRSLETLVGSRMELWARALALTREFALTGVGPGSFGIAANRLYPFLSSPPDQVYPHAHNLFLEIGVTSGVAGLAAFGLLVGICLAGSFRLPRASGDAGAVESRLLLANALGVTAHLLHGLVDSPLWMNRPMPAFFLLLGVLASRQVTAPVSFRPALAFAASWVALTVVGWTLVAYSPLSVAILIPGAGLAAALVLVRHSRGTARGRTGTRQNG